MSILNDSFCRNRILSLLFMCGILPTIGFAFEFTHPVDELSASNFSWGQTTPEFPIDYGFSFHTIDQVTVRAVGTGIAGLGHCSGLPGQPPGPSFALPARVVGEFTSEPGTDLLYESIGDFGLSTTFIDQLMVGPNEEAGVLFDGQAGFRLSTQGVFCIGATPFVLESAAQIMFESVTIIVDGVATCDFDADGTCHIDDINALLEQTTLDFPDLRYDMTGDDDVDISDVDQWLIEAAAANGLAGPYLRGDANLNGFVDVSDFNIINQNKFGNTLRWDLGDMNSDFRVDVSDFNIWNQMKFMDSFGDSAVVPEPAASVQIVIATCLALHGVRRRRD